MPIQVKICGMTTPEAVKAAVSGGAAFVGFVFFPPSPRNVSLDEAMALAACVPPEVMRVGLFVDPTDEAIEETLAALPLDMIQLHGKETPERVAEIRVRFGRPVMKACAVAGPGDLAAARRYEPVADWLLFDAKPPQGSDRPGGNAVSFDWSLLAGRSFSRPWMLAGGIDAANLAEAVRRSGAEAVDVSSAVEDRPGHKDPARIRAFLAAARAVVP